MSCICDKAFLFFIAFCHWLNCPFWKQHHQNKNGANTKNRNKKASDKKSLKWHHGFCTIQKIYFYSVWSIFFHISVFWNESTVLVTSIDFLCIFNRCFFIDRWDIIGIRFTYLSVIAQKYRKIAGLKGSFWWYSICLFMLRFIEIFWQFSIILFQEI